VKFLNLNKMTEIQKQYCEEKGLIYINPENTEISDYVIWLEEQILALRIHDVIGQSEQLVCCCDNPNSFKEMEEGKETCSQCRKSY